MLLEDFVKSAKKQDSRNLFATSEEVEVLKDKDQLFKRFYQDYNPQDVEIDLKEEGVIRFFNLEQLLAVQKEYKSDDYFIFATKNGDPIAIKEGGIYLTLHGQGDYNFKKVAESFKDYLQGLLVKIRS
ncbi:SMI1/KNR4 family protein [Natroniella sp. ANB-PHB2]|uniref:SMI1/KNR4 family protein n=1 Tax=Natroniella sp. ANB-PHB2 TaxID=3384444 RepID=UPI0038D4EC38